MHCFNSTLDFKGLFFVWFLIPLVKMVACTCCLKGFNCIPAAVLWCDFMWCISCLSVLPYSNYYGSKIHKHILWSCLVALLLILLHTEASQWKTQVNPVVWGEFPQLLCLFHWAAFIVHNKKQRCLSATVKPFSCFIMILSTFLLLQAPWVM